MKSRLAVWDFLLYNQDFMFYAICVFLIICEVTWDWFHEIIKKQSPNYKGSNLMRVILGSLLWFSAPLMQTFSVAQWWMIPVLMLSGFWFLFDWWLNLARTRSGHPRPYWYLGENSTLDLWQRSHGGAFAWFWIKGLLFLISLIFIEVVYKMF